MPRPVAKTSTYLPGLDGLRTIAVAAVVLYHLAVPGIPGGLLGVGVFFTLSGYLITSILLKGWDRHGRVKLGDFWLHRVRRLYPAVVLVLATVMLTTLFAEPAKLATRGWESLSALFYYNNWYEILQGNSYFDRFSGPDPLGHMWSLAVEEQFYLFWPLIFAGFMTLIGKRRGGRIAGAVFCLLLAGLSAWWMSYLVQPGLDHTRVYEGTDTRAAGLLIGAALAFMWKPGRSLGRGSRILVEILGVVGLVGIAYLVLTTSDNDMFLYHGGLVALAVCTVLVLLGLAVPTTWISRVVGVAPMRWLGERSYGIYLWHMPIIAFMPQSWLKDYPFLAAPIAIAVTVVLASLSWSYVEDPIRRRGVVGLFTRANEDDDPLASLDGRKRMMGGTGSAAAVNLQSLAADARSRYGTVATSRGAGTVLVGVVSVMAVAVTLTAVPRNYFESEQTPVVDMQAIGGAGGAGGTGDEEKEAAKKAIEKQKASGDSDTSPKLACSIVIHIGDSTSIGLISENTVPEPADRLQPQYLRVGADEVHFDIKGARAAIEHFQSDPNSTEVVQEMAAQNYQDACWMIALGTNDAANMEAGGVRPAKNRIKMILDAIPDNQRILWPTLKTLNPTDQYYNNAAMQQYNKELEGLCTEYPNLKVFEWDKEVQDDWFLPDGIHPNHVGAVERSKRFADALARAYPDSGPDKSTKTSVTKRKGKCVIASGDPIGPSDVSSESSSSASSASASSSATN